MPENNDWGVHMAGHYTIGGDPGGVSNLSIFPHLKIAFTPFVNDLSPHTPDFYSSPGDPLFWFHHGMVDRIWAIWQMQDPENRMNVLPENPPKGDIVDLNWTAAKGNTWDLNDSIGGYDGKFCYIYV
ncbi:Nn.00g042860.m01.CDS01 [Neocucurbitaria sp. VM-36]